jgi:hypothetical protein
MSLTSVHEDAFLSSNLSREEDADLRSEGKSVVVVVVNLESL